MKYAIITIIAALTLSANAHADYAYLETCQMRTAPDLTTQYVGTYRTNSGQRVTVITSTQCEFAVWI